MSASQASVDDWQSYEESRRLRPGWVSSASVARDLLVAPPGRRRRQLRALDRALAGTQLSISAHACARAEEFGFHLHEVIDAVRKCEVSYPSSGDGRICWWRDVAVKVAPDTGAMAPHAVVVVTVMLRTSERFEHGVHTRRHLPAPRSEMLLAQM